MRWQVFVVMFCVALFPLFSVSAAEVPNVMGYHSAIVDEGGNPIQDGEWDVTFRITDVAGSPVYEESQRLSAVGGQISALIGNGLDSSGAPTGGLPLEAVEPGGYRYLEVAIDGMDPLPAQELASVPYASYCQSALSVAAGGVTKDSLDGSVVDHIASQMTDGAGAESIVLQQDLSTVYSEPASATYIGVASESIACSEASNLQSILDDLDQAIAVNSQNIASCEDDKVSREGDTIDGDVNLNGNVYVQDGRTIDGYDISVEFVSINERTSNLESNCCLRTWGTVVGGPSPTISGSNVALSSTSVDNYHVAFTQPFADASYAVVLTPIAGIVESPALPKVYGKTSSGFDVHFDGASTRSFDFIVMGNY